MNSNAQRRSCATDKFHQELMEDNKFASTFIKQKEAIFAKMTADGGSQILITVIIRI